MRAQLASVEAFRQAGLDYATTLIGIKFVIDKRANGQSIIKLSSDKPINDPFVDMLLELNWSSGRLLREYTFLLDPPEIAARAATPVAPAAVASMPGRAIETRSAEERAPGKATTARPRAQEETGKSAEEGGTHTVKRGETLRKIAGETRPEGVSLDQMLVGLFRANKEAFDGGNMNRLQAGKILSVPDKSAVEAVSGAEAKKIVVAQSSDWNAYRRKLAGLAGQSQARDDVVRQEVAGKITAKVEDKAAPSSEPKDRVKVSRTADAASGKPGAADKRSEEDLIAKEKALKEANDRLASLEKNVVELQKLVELKNRNLAEMQKQASAKPAAVEPKKTEVEAPPPASAPAVVPEPVKPAPVAVLAEKPAEAKPEEAKPEAKPPEPKPEEMPKPKPVASPPPPPEAPGFIDELLDSPMALAGGGGILALIAGFFVYKRRRESQGELPLATTSMLSQNSSLTANSVFRSTGGQSVDTSHTPAQTDFSQAGPGSIDTDEVDPVAEADVYMAYGRDAQAEEILLEAKQKDPKRYAIHLKLLEIYSNRKSLKQFETLATDLYSETGGVGAEWEKAAAMGLKLDPQNPLFSGSGQASTQVFDADATVIVSAQRMKDTVTMPGQLSQIADAASVDFSPDDTLKIPAEPVAAPEAAAEPADLTSLDFDLGLAEEAPATAAIESAQDTESTLTLPEAVVETGALDFDLGAGASDVAEKPAAAEVDVSAVSLDFDLPEMAMEAPALEVASQVDLVTTNLEFDAPALPAEPEAAPIAASLDFDLGAEPTPSAGAEVPEEMLDLGEIDSNGLEFDVRLTDSTVLGMPMRDSSFDMSSLSLDLAEPAPEVENLQPVSAFESEQLDTNVNPDFSSEQVETNVNPDFSTEQAETMVNPQFGSDVDMAPNLDISSNEEVATKLDLARAYEEMGDLEGARELLQEVLKEGDTAQQEKAQAVLAKIGQ